MRFLGVVSVDSVKRKVISELFLAPSVVLPIVGGISAGMLSWASGNSYLAGAAMVGILGGVGWMITRMIFKVEDITENVMQAELDKRLRDEEATLDLLARQLRTDRDHRTQDYLTLLRSLRGEFEKVAKQPGVQIRSARVREQVSLVFSAAVDQLRQSFQMWELSENLVGEARNQILGRREQVLNEIGITVERLEATVERYKQLIKTDQKVDLAQMREELEATMRIAQRTEERMREIESPSSNNDSSNYESYNQE
jgi:paraquat-inducible protein B